MKHTGRYCPIEDGFDLEEEINENVKKTIKWIKSIKENCDNNNQSNAILKAMATTIIDELD